MHIQYYLSNGEEIDYVTAFDYVTLEDVDNIAMLVAKARPRSLPDSIFVSVRIYKNFMCQFGTMNHYVPITGVPQVVQINTCVGPLKVIPIPMASDAKLLLIGTREDYDRYDLDKVFEEVVLKDCERDE